LDGSSIADCCFVVPLPVVALLDPAAADDAVVEALFSKGNPVLLRREAEARRAGLAAGLAEALLELLTERRLAVSEAQRQEILLCRDPELLDRWLVRATLGSSVDEVLTPD